MLNYSDGKLTLTESSIRSLDEILSHVVRENLYGDNFIDYLEIKNYISDIVDKLNSGN
jgi:hypothetical protein